MVENRRLTKNERNRLKKAEQKKGQTNSLVSELLEKHDKKEADVEIEYVSANVAESSSSDLMMQFNTIFEKFAKPEDLTSERENVEVAPAEEASVEVVDAVTEETEEAKLSKKKKKLLSRLSVAELKQLVPRPDVVEAHDVTSSDPRMLVFLKAYRNTVPVPRHWCHKRKYLAGKRGIEKPPFQLPEFIADTGIAKIRETVLEQEAARKSSQKSRDKLQPKMGKIDIDYQVLHDAFFKYQKKPKMTIHGDVYYEGKEYEVDLKEKKPGMLSTTLIEALGMQSNAPPPWLVNMQRYGPPPSYPNLRIPGLSAPLPPGAEYGYQPGGWGKPPVDEFGRPVYGDVFGLLLSKGDEAIEFAIDKDFKWGEVVPVEEELEDEEEEDEEEEYSGAGEYVKDSGVETPMEGAQSSGTMSAISSGLDSSMIDALDLRKHGGDSSVTEAAYVHKELYQVVQEKQSDVTGGQLFGSDRTYVMGGSTAEEHPGQDSSEDNTGLKEEEGQSAKKQRTDSTAASKRYKDFKF